MEDLSPIYSLIQDDLNNMVRRLAEYSNSMNGNQYAKTQKLRMENERLKSENTKLRSQTKMRHDDEDISITQFSPAKPPEAVVKPPSRALARMKTMDAVSNIYESDAKGDEKEKQPEKKNIFPDAQAMKEKLRANLSKKEYNVSDLYKQSGWARTMATSRIFEMVTFAVIALNSLWIAIDTDENTATNPLNARPVFLVMDNLFCIFFCFEIFVRFAAFERKRSCLGDRPFLFDAFLVFMMVMETWVLLIFIATFLGTGDGVDLSSMRMLRLVRITRIARMARLIRAMPELLILVKGIGVAGRSVLFTLVLLMLFTYVFAVCQRQLMDYFPMDEELSTGKFSNVWSTMWVLSMDGIVPDYADLIRLVNDQSISYGILSTLFVLLAGVTVMNMLVGVLVEVVGVVSAVEKEAISVNFVKERLFNMFSDMGLDREDHDAIDQNSFQALLMQPVAARIINDIGVDVVGLVDLSEHIFKDKEELTFAEFMEVIYQMRGSNAATVKDIVDLRRYTSLMIEGFMDRMSKELKADVSASCSQLRFHDYSNSDEPGIGVPLPGAIPAAPAPSTWKPFVDGSDFLRQVRAGPDNGRPSSPQPLGSPNGNSSPRSRRTRNTVREGKPQDVQDVPAPTDMDDGGYF